MIVHDAGTGASWSLFEYPDVIWYHRGKRTPVRAAYGGLVAAQNSQLVYLTPDGQSTKLYGREPSYHYFQVSPDGRKVVAHFYSYRGADEPAHLIIFDLPSGNQILRLDDTDIIAALGEVPPGGETLVIRLKGASSGMIDAWSSDSAAILITGERRGDGPGGGRAGTVTLDGEIAFLDSAWHPGPLEPESESPASADCPENPAHSCRILLDGAVVGEGRWPAIIGVIELD